jgi:hypothetical protein
MPISVLRGVIDRRILVNYRVDPAVLASLLPAPFRPKLVRGQALAGICLIRLKFVRPRLLPWWMGLSSENAAHRAAVEWEEGGATRQGIYIWRRDTSSRLNALAGGKLFPGIHHRGRFTVAEDTHSVSVSLTSGGTELAVHGWRARAWPESSVFTSIDEASAFFEAGSLGYSATPQSDRFHGIELRCRSWRVEPLAIASVRSSFFDDRSRFPPGTIALDCALFMRGIEHEWHGRADLRVPGSATPISRMAEACEFP